MRKVRFGARAELSGGRNDANDPNRSFLVPCSWSKREELKDQTFATDVSGLLHNSLRAHPSEPQTCWTVATGRSKQATQSP